MGSRQRKRVGDPEREEQRGRGVWGGEVGKRVREVRPREGGHNPHGPKPLKWPEWGLQVAVVEAGEQIRAAGVGEQVEGVPRNLGD